MSATFLAACAQRSANAMEQPASVPPPIARQDSAVLRDVNLCHHIFVFLPLADLARAALRTDRTFRDVARERLKRLWPVLSLLLDEPFRLSKRDIVEMTVLKLSSRRIGGAGAIALAQACASGALGSLKYLSLSLNGLGDAGIIAFADGIKPTPENPMGALGNVEYLSLEGNQIGDEGMAAFSAVISSGALDRLTRLELQYNQIGNDGMKAFFAALGSGTLGALTKLQLAGNLVSDAGISAFCAAIKPTPENPMVALASLQKQALSRIIALHGY